MAEISSAAVALIVVFIFVLLGIAAELTYVLWYRRKFRRGPLFATGDQEASPAGGDAFGTPDSKELLLYHVLSRGHQSRSERAPPTGEPLYSVTAAIGFAWPGSDSPYYSQARPSPSPPWHGGVFYGGFHGAPVAEKEKEEGFSPGKVWEEEQKPAAAVKKEQKPAAMVTKEQKPPLAVKKEQKPPPAVKKEQKPPLAVKKGQKAARPQRKEEEKEMVPEEEGKEEVVEEEAEKSGFEFSQMEASTPSTPFYTPTPSPPRVSARDWDLGRYLAELDDEVLSPPAERLLRRPKIPK